MDSPLPNLKICILVGEPSGDMLGAHLIMALQKRNPHITFVGTAGDRMKSLGLKSLVSLKNLSLMGWLISPLQLGKIFNAYRKIKKMIQDEKPDVIVTIDFPGVNFRLAKALKKGGSTIPLIHYVAPTVWAWRPQRAKKVAKLADHLLTLFPFEPPYFTKENLPTTFVGHPLTQEQLDGGNGALFREKFKVAPDAMLICLLPGSRLQEITTHLPIFKATIQLLQQSYPNLELILPTLPSTHHLLDLKNWPCKVHVVTELEDKKNAYRAAAIAIAASGTVTLELALAKVPMVVSYKTAALNAWILRRFLITPFVCMVNILLKKEIVPELLQENCTPQKIAQAFEKILKNPQQQVTAFQEIHSLLSPPSPFTSPDEAAAKIILDYALKK